MGSGAEKRNRALALRCANLAAQGQTHRAIAKLVGKKPEQIKLLVLLGQRISQVEPASPDPMCRHCGNPLPCMC